MPDPTLHTKVVIDGAEDVNAKLKGIEKTGTDAAVKVASTFEQTGQKMRSFGRELSNVGGVMTRDITLPLAAISAGLVKVTSDVSKNEAAVKSMGGSGQQVMAEYKASVLGVTTAWMDARIEIARNVAPTLTALNNDVIAPLTYGLGELTDKWAAQTEAAKNAEIMIGAIIATAGPLMAWSGTVVAACGAATLAFGGVTATLIGVGGTVAALIAVASAAGLAYGELQNLKVAQGMNAGLVPGTQNEAEAMRAALGGIGGTGLPSVSDIQAGAQAANERARVPTVRDLVNRAGGGGGGGGGSIGTGIGDLYAGIRDAAANAATRALWLRNFIEGSIAAMYANAFQLPGRMFTTGGGRGIGGAVPPELAGQGGAFSLNLGPTAGHFGTTGFEIPGTPFAMPLPAIPTPKGMSTWAGGLKTLGSTDFLTSAGAAAAGTLIAGGSGRDLAAGLLPMIGSAFGPVGAAIGGVLGALFGRKKPRGNDPANPVYVKDINTGNLLTELMNITKSQIGRTGAGVIDRLASELGMQSMSRGLT